MFLTVTGVHADAAEENVSFVLTQDELDYVADSGVIRVGVNLSRPPFSEYDEETNSFVGINIDILNEISRTTGLVFEYIPMTAGVRVPDLLAGGGYDLICGIERDNFKNSETIVATEAYMESAIVPVGITGNNIDLSSELTAAFPSSFQALEKRIADYPNLTAQMYETNTESIDAVLYGEADIFIQNTHIISRMLQNPKYEKLSIMPVKIMTEHTAMAMLKTTDPRLLSILNKAIVGLDQVVLDSSLITHTFTNHYKITVGDFIYKFRTQITIVSVLITACFIMLISMLTVRRRSELAVQKKNAQLSEAIKQAEQANATKSQFLAHMSHEIRTPMNAIVGMTTLAKGKVSDPEKTLDYLRKIDISSKVLLNIINDVLDMSAIENNKLKIAHIEFNLKELVTSLSTLYYSQCNAKKIKFEICIQDVTEEILIGDSLRLNQILLNLMSNALKFTPNGGSITLYVTQLSIKESRVYMEFKVTDTGCGMSEEVLSRVFKPFEQAGAETAMKYGGSGLGLSITKNLVDLMHGTIHVESKENAGTTFTVNIPFEFSKKTFQSSADKLKSIKALVVDDDVNAREYTTAVLTRIGIQHECAISGAQAIEMLDKAHGEGSGYDVCFVDWKMPGIDGVQLTRKIREMYDEDTVIIIVSAYDLSEIEEEAREAGANKFVTKPLFQSTVFDVLMNLSGGKYKNLTADANDFNFTGKKVLVAEDNALNMEIAVELLEMTHLEVVSAKNGREAFEIFINSEPKTFDVILMDIQMPIMDGYEVTRKIRASEHPQAKTIPIFAMTANAFTEDVNMAISCGMDDHISKPIDTEELYSKLKGVLN